MIPASTSLVPSSAFELWIGEMSEELELESTRFSELDTQREQLEALIHWFYSVLWKLYSIIIVDENVRIAIWGQ